jgi:hypothetical protein
MKRSRRLRSQQVAAPALVQAAVSAEAAHTTSEAKPASPVEASPSERAPEAGPADQSVVLWDEVAAPEASEQSKLLQDSLPTDLGLPN